MWYLLEAHFEVEAHLAQNVRVGAPISYMYLLLDAHCEKLIQGRATQDVAVLIAVATDIQEKRFVLGMLAALSEQETFIGDSPFKHMVPVLELSTWVK